MSNSIQHLSIDPDEIVNFLVVNKMQQYSGSEFKTYMLIYHATFGRCLQEAQISLDDFARYTGLARNTVLRSINSLLEQDQIVRYTHTKIYTYSLNTVTLFGPGGSEIPVQKYYITHKSTPKQEFSGPDQVVLETK